MYQIHKHCLLFTFLLICVSPLAQTIKVVDADIHMPVSNVMVFDETETMTAGTNDDGIVDISLFKRDAHLWFKHPAYELYVLSSKKQLPKYITLCPKIFTLDEFVVSASRTQENKKNIPYFLKSVQPRTIQFKNTPTAADILSSSGYVAVQKARVVVAAPF